MSGIHGEPDALAEARVLADALGNFVVVYRSPVPGPDEHLFGQRFTRFGERIGMPVDLGIAQRPPSSGVTRNEIAMDEQGNLIRVVALQIPGTNRVQMQARFHANTLQFRRVMPLFEIPVDAQLRRFNPGGSQELEDWIPTADATELSYALAADADGDFVITYGQRVSGDSGQPGRSHIFARRFKRNGVPAGSPIQVSEDNAVDHLVSSVDMDRRGNFLVGWRQREWVANDQCEPSACLSYPMYPAAARRFGRQGQPLAPIIHAGTDCSTRYHVGPDVALDEDGDLVVAYEHEEDCIHAGDGVGNEPFSQVLLFDAAGTLRREFGPFDFAPGRRLQFVAPDVAALSTREPNEPVGHLQFFEVGYGDASAAFGTLSFGYHDDDRFPQSILHDFASYGSGHLVLGWSRGLDADPFSNGPRIFTLSRLLGPGGVACRYAAATIVGRDAPDRIIGTDDQDIIHALNGNDVVDGRGGDDVICAGNGDDLVHGGDGYDRLYGSAGSDALYGDAGNDELHGSKGNDVLDGGSGNDRLFGGADEDRLAGLSGDDLLHGNEGDDALFGGPGDDQLYGDDGTDLARGGSGWDLCENSESIGGCP